MTQASGTMRDDAWYEREYNPRVTVAETTELLAAWPKRAENIRSRRPFLADLPTGSHPRERVDIFRAEQPRGVLVFIHGGYWRAFSKVETAWIADGFVDKGWSVALLNYPLCPEVTLAELTASVQRSFAVLWRDHLTEAERGAILVSGHSAGGHLAAMLIATDWTARGLPARPFHAALPVSGLFELAPLIRTTMNQAIRLDEASAALLSPARLQPTFNLPLLMAAGEHEPCEFHRQGSLLAAAWPSLRAEVLAVPDTNHFTIVEKLADPDHPLNRAACDLLAAAR